MGQAARDVGEEQRHCRRVEQGRADGDKSCALHGALQEADGELFPSHAGPMVA